MIRRGFLQNNWTEEKLKSLKIDENHQKLFEILTLPKVMSRWIRRTRYQWIQLPLVVRKVIKWISHLTINTMEIAILERRSDEQEQQFSFGTQPPKRPAERVCVKCFLLCGFLMHDD